MSKKKTLNSEIQVFGRESVISRIWGILETKSIYMNDVRRIGKTQILRKMEAEPLDGWRVIHEDVEGVRSPEEFANLIYRKAYQGLSSGKTVLRRAGELLASLGGAEVGGVLTLPEGKAKTWKELLERTINDLDEACEDTNEALVFLIDELPYMLYNMDAAEAAEVLDILRKISQVAQRLRFVFTGSIGLHHVLAKLHQGDYLGSPFNHLEPITPGPLAHSDAVAFAKSRVLSEGIESPDLDVFSERIATRVGDIPFYIEKVVARLALAGETSPDQVEVVVDSALLDPNSGWDLEHYRKRLRNYYRNRESLALAVLDHLARDGSDVSSFEEIERVIRGQSGTGIEQEVIREVLKLLLRDFYLERVAGGYRFYLPLLRRWWQLDRDLQN